MPLIESFVVVPTGIVGVANVVTFAISTKEYCSIPTNSTPFADTCIEAFAYAECAGETQRIDWPSDMEALTKIVCANLHVTSAIEPRYLLTVASLLARTRDTEVPPRVLPRAGTIRKIVGFWKYRNVIPVTSCDDAAASAVLVASTATTPIGDCGVEQRASDCDATIAGTRTEPPKRHIVWP
jgi:hypothetical protein